jgi:hypothetical protein
LRDRRIKGLITSRLEKYDQRDGLDYCGNLADIWLLGFSFHIGGGLIHIVLVIVVIVLVIRLVTGRGL